MVPSPACLPGHDTGIAGARVQRLPAEAAGVPVLPQAGHLPPTGHPPLPEPDGEALLPRLHPASCTALTPSLSLSYPRTWQPTPCPHGVQETRCSSACTRVTAPPTQLYTVGLHALRRRHTPSNPSHKHSATHSLHSLTRHLRRLHAHTTNALSRTYTRSFSQTSTLTLVHTHSQTRAPKSPLDPLSAFGLLSHPDRVLNHSPKPACFPHSRPKGSYLVPGSLSQTEAEWGPLPRPNHLLTLRYALEPEGRLRVLGPVQTRATRARAGARAIRPPAGQAGPLRAAWGPPGEARAADTGEMEIQRARALAEALDHLVWEGQRWEGDQQLQAGPTTRPGGGDTEGEASRARQSPEEPSVQLASSALLSPRISPSSGSPFPHPFPSAGSAGM